MLTKVNFSIQNRSPSYKQEIDIENGIFQDDWYDLNHVQASLAIGHPDNFSRNIYLRFELYLETLVSNIESTMAVFSAPLRWVNTTGKPKLTVSANIHNISVPFIIDTASEVNLITLKALEDHELQDFFFPLDKKFGVIPCKKNVAVCLDCEGGPVNLILDIMVDDRVQAPFAILGMSFLTSCSCTLDTSESRPMLSFRLPEIKP